VFLSKNFSKKILPKKSSQNIHPQKIIPNKSPPKNKKKSRKNKKKFQKNSQKIPTLKIFNSLHRTWRPKTLSGLF
jgi:hypothetical protein